MYGEGISFPSELFERTIKKQQLYIANYGYHSGFFSRLIHTLFKELFLKECTLNIHFNHFYLICTSLQYFLSPSKDGIWNQIHWWVSAFLQVSAGGVLGS